MEIRSIIEAAGTLLDGLGVAVIVVGVFASGINAAVRWVRRERDDIYSRFRSQLGRSILLGLELLVGADIVRTVAVAPTINSVLALGLIIVIRTFLSFSLELEISGRWPWQKRSAAPDGRLRPE